jgi:sugar phosphate isomerase/epimerase
MSATQTATSREQHRDIRIGTLVGIRDAAKVVPQIIEYGFESFQLTGGFGVGEVDFADIAARVKDALGDRAVLSSIGYFGNPLQKPEDAELFGKYIDACPAFGVDVIIGFAGALEDRPIDKQWDKFKEVWQPLAQRAADKGVKIGFENCDMGGTWQRPLWNVAHSPAAFDVIFNELSLPNVGLCWEPCHQMVSLIDPIPQLRKYVDRVWHVHGKDATIAWDVLRSSGLRGGKQWVWHRHPGFGDTDWRAILDILRLNKWTGSIDIEGWHDPVLRGDLEYTGQVAALKYLKQCRGGDYVPNPQK